MKEKWVTEDCTKAKIWYTIFKAYNSLRYQTVFFFLFLWQMTSIAVFFCTPLQSQTIILQDLHRSDRSVQLHCIICSPHLTFYFKLPFVMNVLLICPAPVKRSPWPVQILPCSLCHFAFELAASFLLCWPCRFQFSGLLIAPRLLLEVLTPAKTGWRPSVCRSDHWHWYSPVSGCGSTTRQPAFTLSYINNLFFSLKSEFRLKFSTTYIKPGACGCHTSELIEKLGPEVPWF